MGYDLRDRSVTNRLYLVYFGIFWLIWAVAVFSMAGSSLAELFRLTKMVSPPQVAATITSFAIVIWSLIVFWQVTHRSPFVFSEEDAFLLCMTPVNRRKVGLIWYLQGVIETWLPAIVAATIFGFAISEWSLPGKPDIASIFGYLYASGKAILMLLPLLAGWLAFIWGLGAMRLHGGRRADWLKLLSTTAILVFLASLYFDATRSLFTLPVYYPLQMAFTPQVSTVSYWIAFGTGVVYLAIGFAWLYLQSGAINISQSAQETRHVATINLAIQYGYFNLLSTLLLRRKPKLAHKPSGIFSIPIGSVLFRKNCLVGLRSLRLGDIIPVVFIFGLTIGMLIATDRLLILALAGVWAFVIGSFCARFLRKDLARWWILRSLPVRGGPIIRDEILLSCAVSILLTWAAMFLTGMPIDGLLYNGSLLALMAVNASLAATHDILRQSKARTIMSPSLAEENIPQMNIWGVLQSLVSVLVPFGLMLWAIAPPVLFLPHLAGAAIAVVNGALVVSAYRSIE